jgi:hypothetical protein
METRTPPTRGILGRTAELGFKRLRTCDGTDVIVRGI